MLIQIWKIKLKSYLSKQKKGKSFAFTPASHLTLEFIQEFDCSKLNIIGFFDKDKKKYNKKVLGYNVYNTETLNQFNPDIIVILSMGYESEIRDCLSELKLTSDIIGIAGGFID